uniref:RxLR effector candidate protein n=1 Tax=Hyaloperonospora arabidopsidis (strain Emoy2) TaxID=559515 RepID=M4B9M4_HYAAE
MLRGQYGLHWFVEGSIPQLDIFCSIERRTVITAFRKWGLVFEAHPQRHQFPWSVPDVTPIGYRVALDQLNLYHAGRTEDKSCRKILACRCREDTIDYLFWVCPCAVALWSKLVRHWIEERETRQRTQQFLEACASRQVQAIPKHRAGTVKERFQDDVVEAERVWK